MLKTGSTLAGMLVLVVSGCASAPSDRIRLSGEVFDSPIGEWTERYEASGASEHSPGAYTSTREIKLTIIDETRGFSDGNQRIEFHEVDEQGRWKGYWISDRTMAKYYRCDEAKSGSEFWGELIYEFNDTYNYYSGLWDRCGEGDKYTLVGYR